MGWQYSINSYRFKNCSRNCLWDSQVNFSLSLCYAIKLISFAINLHVGLRKQCQTWKPGQEKF
jgi:hypothetical protein